MTTVLRCDVCGEHSQRWMPADWKQVRSVGVVVIYGDKNVCAECWQFLVDNRGDGSQT